MKTLLLITSLFALTLVGTAQTYTLPKLNYSYNSLEPSIDEMTMTIHHTKHHQGYVNNLNAALLGTVDQKKELTDILLNISHYSTTIRNNGGGHYNHSLFWEILTPTKNTQPSEALQKAIEANFTSMDSLKKLMNKAASTRFGSGWAWLSLTPDLKLIVTSTPNQDNPLMDIIPTAERGIPIFGIDVWEHAYYLKYQNKRGDYLSSIWEVVDWNSISKKYAEAIQSPILKSLSK